MHVVDDLITMTMNTLLIIIMIVITTEAKILLLECACGKHDIYIYRVPVSLCKCVVCIWRTCGAADAIVKATSLIHG